MAGKGKGKEGAAAPAASTSTASAAPAAAATASKPATNASTASTSTTAAATAPAMHTKGDWAAVWNADVGKYYFWNKATNATTWTNPFENGDAAASASTSTAATETSSSTKEEAAGSASPSQTREASQSAAATGAEEENKEDASGAPSAEDFGGIDPDLAYLDPSLAGRKRGAGGAGQYAARFNARTGRFEGDPTRNPERVSEVERAKRQNQFYFDYDGWQATLAQQQDQTAQKRAAEGYEDDDSANKRLRPSKKEMEAIRARNKEKKDKRQKGWLLN